MNKTTQEIRKLRAAMYERIATDIKRTPMTYLEIAKKHEVSTGMVYLVARLYNCRRTFAVEQAEDDRQGRVSAKHA